MIFSIFFISSALLSFEIILMRVLQIEGFGNFTFSAIAIALIGFGASGTMVYLLRKPIEKNPEFSFWLSSTLFIIFLGMGFYFSYLINFDPLRIVWEVRQSLKLLLILMCFSLPFLAGSFQIAVGFTLFEAGETYFSNLAGSFIGIIFSIIFMYLLDAKALLLIPLAFGSISSIISLIIYIENSEKNNIYRIAIFLLLIPIGFFLYSRGDVKIMEYRPLKLALNLPDVKNMLRKYSPFGIVDVLKSKYIRVVHGLSLKFEGTLPEQLGIYIDGDMLAPFDLAVLPSIKTSSFEDILKIRTSPDPESNIKGSRSTLSYPDYLFYLPQQAPYILKSRPEVFLAGLGGRSNVERAFLNNASRILVTEENPVLIKTISQLEDIFKLGKISKYCTITNTTPRIYLTKNGGKWDIIELSLPETSLHSISGIYSRSSAYNLTTEAIELYMNRLKENGILSITILLKNPPRKLPRLVNNIITALKNQEKNPEERVFIIRSWSTATIMAKKVPFSPGEIEKIKKFCERMSFDLVYYPGIKRNEVNRYNIVQDAIYYRTVNLLLKNNLIFEKRYIFNIRTTADNNPFFTFFIKISKIGELFAQTGRQWLFVIEGGYLVIFITFILVCILSFVMIVFPLFIKTNENLADKSIRKVWFRVFCYYSSIGLGYMLVELTIIERFNLLIVNPIFSSSTTIGVLLLFSGLGAYMSRKINNFKIPEIMKNRIPKWIIAIISCYFFLFLSGLAFGYGKIMALKPIIKYALCFSAIVPMALMMGIPFPSSIEALKSKYGDMIPWAWSVNGYFSVIASSGAIIIMVSIGVNQTGFLAALLYLLAIPFFPRS